MVDFVVSDLLQALEDRAEMALDADVTLEERENIPPPDQMRLEVPRWHRVDDVVAVVADLKGSTSFNTGRNEKTIARVYESYMGPLVQAVDSFDPAFIAIQGDGLFALFDGPDRVEMAIAAGVTLKTFVQLRLMPHLVTYLADLPATGLKVGIASGPVFVKRVGIRDDNEPIWAGRPVNWAAKCAQACDAGELIVTKDVWSKLESNDYVTLSCLCNGPATSLWSEIEVAKLPEDARACMRLGSNWCTNCGDEFCTAILRGQTSRDLPR